MLNMWLIAYKNDTINAYFIQANSHAYTNRHSIKTKELTLEWQLIENTIFTHTHKYYVTMKIERRINMYTTIDRETCVCLFVYLWCCCFSAWRDW